MITLDKKKIHLDHPIRTLGDHEIELRLHPEVTTTLKVHVESTTPLPEPAEAPEARGREGARPGRREGYPPRTEKRGRRPEGKPGVEAKAEIEVKPARTEKGARTEKPQRPVRSPKADKPAKGEKAEKAD